MLARNFQPPSQVSSPKYLVFLLWFLKLEGGLSPLCKPGTANISDFNFVDGD